MTIFFDYNISRKIQLTEYIHKHPYGLANIIQRSKNNGERSKEIKIHATNGRQ